MRPDLTIAIPTYNRAKKLSDCVRTVIEYSKGKNIEIIISDNASTDNTRLIVNKLIELLPTIKYFRNKENLGFDGNFLNCFEKATGKYIWILSDDDVLLPGAIESVMQGLKKNPVCMHLNSSTLKKEEPVVVGKARFKEEGLKIFLDKNEFVERIGIYCTFISSIIFDLDIVRNIPNKERYFGTNILQSHILFETMNNDGIYLINTYNCIAARDNTSVKYDVLKTWVQNYSELFLNTAKECGFDDERMNEVLRIGLSTTVYEFILGFRQTCANENEWDRECIWPYIERYPEIIDKYKKAVYCPISKLKRIYYIYKIRNKFNSIFGVKR